MELAGPEMDGAALAHLVSRERLAPAMQLLTAEVRRPFGSLRPEGTALMHVSKPFAVGEFLPRTRILLDAAEPRLPAPRVGGTTVRDRAGS